MEQSPSNPTDSKIRLEEEDWAIRFGALQLALEQNIEDWYSQDGKYFYRAIAKFIPYEGMPSYDFKHDVPTTIPDPEFISDMHEANNPSEWIIARSLASEIDAIRAHPVLRSRSPTPSKLMALSKTTSFVIDERKRSVRVVEAEGDMTVLAVREVPDFQDVADLCVALDDLHHFVNKSISC
ncbi:MAG: hypothetical protein M3Q14_00445 [bacterium]|nr:hypothetical protein [bacterium]